MITHQITPTWIYIIGFAAQGIFAARMALQWLWSEKKGETITPPLFWTLSLMGCLVLLVYGVLRHDPVIIIGQLLGYAIYIRNLAIEGSWPRLPFVLKIIIVGIPAAIVVYAYRTTYPVTTTYQPEEKWLFIAGSIGQLLMNLRFVYQWYFAEKTKSATLPVGFWQITLVASMLILFYAFYRLDPVLLVAQSFSLVSALRNIHLGRMKKQILANTDS